MTNKQIEEIKFLINFGDISEAPSKDIIQEYLDLTTKGIGASKGKFNQNELFQAKRKLDINIKMWSQGVNEGLFVWDEIMNDFDSPYLTKVINTIKRKNSISSYSLDLYGINLINRQNEWKQKDLEFKEARELRDQGKLKYPSYVQVEKWDGDKFIVLKERKY